MTLQFPPTQHDPKLPLSAQQASLPKLHPFLHDVTVKGITSAFPKLSISITVETPSTDPYTAASENPSPSVDLLPIATLPHPITTRAASRNISAETLNELTEEGLRLAEQDEPGWTWVYINDSGERVTLWVTS
jgi:hypothetical protein